MISCVSISPIYHAKFNAPILTSPSLILVCFYICVKKFWLLYACKILTSCLNFYSNNSKTRDCAMFASIPSTCLFIAGQEWRAVASGCASVGNSVTCCAPLLLPHRSHHVSGCQSAFTPVCLSCCQWCIKHLWSSVWRTSCLKRVSGLWYQVAVAPCSSNLFIHYYNMLCAVGYFYLLLGWVIDTYAA